MRLKLTISSDRRTCELEGHKNEQEQEQGRDPRLVADKEDKPAVELSAILPAMSADRPRHGSVSASAIATATPRPTLSPSPSYLPSPVVPISSSHIDPVTARQNYIQYWREHPQDASLVAAGYQPAFEPPPPPAIELDPRKRRRKKQNNMAEPRARVARHKGQMNFSSERMSTNPSSRCTLSVLLYSTPLKKSSQV